MKETRFKQTEIGLIPEDWDLSEIGDLANISSGGTPDTTNLQFLERRYSMDEFRRIE